MRLTLSARTSKLDHRNMPILRPAVAALLTCVMGFATASGFARPPKIPSPEVMKTKVEKLGVGEHVMVRRTDGPELHGRITGIEQQAFKLKPDHAQAEVLIPYDHVLKVRKNPGAITWMLVGAALVIIIIVAATR